MEDRARSHPRASPHHGYVYFLLYVSGVYLIRENRKVACGKTEEEEVGVGAGCHRPSRPRSCLVGLFSHGAYLGQSPGSAHILLKIHS